MTDPRYTSSELKGQHQKANAELTILRRRKRLLYEQLNDKEAQQPGSVSEAEWKKGRDLEALSIEKQAEVDHLAREMSFLRSEEIRQAQKDLRDGIADGLIAGDAPKDIADRLGCSKSTVYRHRRDIMRKRDL